MILDTFAWIELFEGTKKGQTVDTIIRNRQCYTSAISLAELSAWIETSGLDRKLTLNTVKKTSIVIALDEPILENAGILKIQKRKIIKDFGLIAAIILSTAKQYNLKIVT